MDKIISFFDKSSLDKILPKLDSVIDVMQKMMQWAIKLGPICILVLGLIYLLIPPKEANRHFGFRTYFGMGSIPAWLFTQRVSGTLMSVVGLCLYLTANKAAKAFVSMDFMEITEKALAIMKVQIISALVIYVFMFLLTAVMFNRKGVCRFAGIRNTAFGRLLVPDDPSLMPKKKRINFTSKQTPAEAVPAAAQESIPEDTRYTDVAEEEAVEYERQGEQVITADDIVIEGLDE